MNAKFYTIFIALALPLLCVDTAYAGLRKENHYTYEQVKDEVRVSITSFKYKEMEKQFGGPLTNQLKLRNIVPLTVKVNNNKPSSQGALIFDRANINIPYLSHEEMQAELNKVNKYMKRYCKILTHICIIGTMFYLTGLGVALALIPGAMSSFTVIVGVFAAFWGVILLGATSVMAVSWYALEVPTRKCSKYYTPHSFTHMNYIESGEEHEEIIFVKEEELNRGTHSICLNVGLKKQNFDIKYKKERLFLSGKPVL